MNAQPLPDIDAYFSDMSRFLSQNGSPRQKLLQAVVDAPFMSKIDATFLDLGIVVLLLLNKKTGMIDRVALSDTHAARGAVNISDKPFEEIKIPFDDPENIIAKTIRSGKPQETVDWKYLFTPDLSPRSARFNQAAAGIDCSFVYPLERLKSGGAMIFSYYQPLPHINDAHREFMEHYSELAGRTLQKLL